MINSIKNILYLIFFFTDEDNEVIESCNEDIINCCLQVIDQGNHVVSYLIMYNDFYVCVCIYLSLNNTVRPFDFNASLNLISL